MNKSSVLLSGALLALVALSASVTLAVEPRAQLEEAMSHDGLEKIKVKGIDLAYARPGATLAGYDKLIIDPVEVAFRKDWDPNRTGSRMKLDAKEREDIRSGVSTIVQEEFAKEIGKGGTYQVVTEAGPDVLRLRASIADLYVNAPDTMSPGRTRTYTISAGEMTLVAELVDSESGQVIARVVDRRESQGTGMMTLTNSVVNRQEAGIIASSWARILRKRLDAAHGIGRK
jgi:beta-galactosidase GanA